MTDNFDDPDRSPDFTTSDTTVGSSSTPDGGPLSFPASTVGTVQKTALIYLRVSTQRQARKGGESEGFSIPAQRQACIRRAGELGAVVVDEFADAGASARSANRAQLQALLARVAAGGIDYVVVHKIDRLARDRGDDVQIMMAIRKAGATLISVTENIDETPQGKLMHGIFASMAEFYSANLGAEARKGLEQKVARGGTPSYAPIGYLNVGRMVDGYEMRTVELDPDRAPHILWAFHTYATGKWSIADLRDALEDRGLMSRQTRTLAGTPLTTGQIHRFLRKPYYKGLVTFRDALHPGTHEPLVDEATWDKVQAILDGRRIAGDRAWRHGHYLKGITKCGRCGSRLGYGHSRGKQGGIYSYFFCLGRHTGRKVCDLPYIPVEKLEDAVAKIWVGFRFSEEDLAAIRAETIAEQERQDKDDRAQLHLQRQRLARAKAKRQKLLDAYLDDAISVEVLREKQSSVEAEIATAIQMLAEAESDQLTLIERLDLVLASVANGEEWYLNGDEQTRQALNEAVFEAFEIDFEITENPDETGPHAADVALSAPAKAARACLADQARKAPQRGGHDPYRVHRSGSRHEETPESLSHSGGSNFAILAEMAGFEPASGVNRNPLSRRAH